MARQNQNLKGLIVTRYGTQSDFAREIGWPDDRVSRVVCGRKRLSDDERAMWSAALGCPVEQLGL